MAGKCGNPCMCTWLRLPCTLASSTAWLLPARRCPTRRGWFATLGRQVVNVPVKGRHHPLWLQSSGREQHKRPAIPVKEKHSVVFKLRVGI